MLQVKELLESSMVKLERDQRPRRWQDQALAREGLCLIFEADRGTITFEAKPIGELTLVLIPPFMHEDGAFKRREEAPES